jgi:Ca2+-transporting ATPase
LGGVILALCATLFILGVATGKDSLEMLITSVAVAVAAIPEGLPAAVTVTFAFGMREILKRGGLVKELVAAEILGSASVICTDKTGTLTEAKMQVEGIFPCFQGRCFNKDSSGKFDGASLKVLKIAVLATNAFVENPDDELHQWVVRGEPTERAVLMAGIQAGLDKKELLKQYVEVDRTPFDRRINIRSACFVFPKRKPFCTFWVCRSWFLKNRISWRLTDDKSFWTNRGAKSLWKK